MVRLPIIFPDERTKIKNRIKNPVNGFSSIEEYVDYVLEEVLFEKEDNNVSEKEDNNVSDEERRKIQDELKKLGYI